MKRSKILAATVLHFHVLGNLQRSPAVVGYKKELRLRSKGKVHKLVLHFVGRPTEIRANERWAISSFVPDSDPQDGVVRHHFICRPVDQTATVNAYRLSNGQVSFYRGRRRNTGPANQGANCRPQRSRTAA